MYGHLDKALKTVLDIVYVINSHKRISLPLVIITGMSFFDILISSLRLLDWLCYFAYQFSEKNTCLVTKFLVCCLTNKTIN